MPVPLMGRLEASKTCNICSSFGKLYMIFSMYRSLCMTADAVLTVLAFRYLIRVA